MFALRNIIASLLLSFSIVSVVSADSREVSILTCSPGDKVYELFGHTALRVCDPERGVDAVFNYGLFSFDEPGFIWRFVSGETDYLLGVIDFRHFMAEYEARGSGVTEQVLRLDSLQKSNLINALVRNSLPEYRKYRYNFLYNNCTTKARDVVCGVLNDELSYDFPSVGDTLSFRQIIHGFTRDYPWYAFGMDILLGAPADVTAGRSGAQFAPMLLKKELAGANILHNGEIVPLLMSQRELLLPQPKYHAPDNFSPFNASLLLLLFTFMVMLCEKRSKKTYLMWDVLLMGLQGVAGCILAFLVLFSQHPAVDENWLLLFLNPLPLLMLPFLIKAVRNKKTPHVMWMQVAMVVLFVLLSPLLPQYFPTPLYICAVTLLVRSLFHIYKKNICALD
ncbi:MAG: DUF4105 domain-containing protein [Bacteroidaceae bacterium]|nr:DUF4105 domain-containing protein [Bacteroidaceae bacterium]